MVVFSPKIFKFTVFHSETPQRYRAEKIKEMLKLQRKGYSKTKLIEMGYKDCMGEVAEYYGDGSWSSRSFKGVNEPSWMWECGLKVGKNVPEDKEIEKALGEDDE